MKVIIQTGDPDKLRKKYAVQYSFPELQLYHPKFHAEFIEEYILSNHRWNKNSDVVTIITNSEHMINRLRVAHKEGEIELIIHWYPFEDKPMQLIRVDNKGELSDYPTGLLDEWSNQLIKLL